MYSNTWWNEAAYTHFFSWNTTDAQETRLSKAAQLNAMSFSIIAPMTCSLHIKHILLILLTHPALQSSNLYNIIGTIKGLCHKSSHNKLSMAQAQQTAQYSKSSAIRNSGDQEKCPN